jgi:hypothetical protein
MRFICNNAVAKFKYKKITFARLALVMYDKKIYMQPANFLFAAYSQYFDFMQPNIFSGCWLLQLTALCCTACYGLLYCDAMRFDAMHASLQSTQCATKFQYQVAY